MSIRTRVTVAIVSLMMVFGMFSPITIYAQSPIDSSSVASNGIENSASFDEVNADSLVQGSWKLIWSDEFDGPNGAPIDQTKWGFETGGTGWNQNELQNYTDRTDNAQIQDGNLQIVARNESFQGNQYTSARLISKGKFEQAYGRFEARMKIPTGQGLWPAFWLLGNDIDTAYWPQCGEIDIMEHVNREAVIAAHLHGPSYSSKMALGQAYSLPGNEDFGAQFHTYAVEWEPDMMRFYVDDILYYTASISDLPEGRQWVYDHPYYMILNLAVGGNWPGAPDATTVFPAVLSVDYVRVYIHNDWTYTRHRA